MTTQSAFRTPTFAPGDTLSRGSTAEDRRRAAAEAAKARADAAKARAEAAKKARDDAAKARAEAAQARAEAAQARAEAAQKARDDAAKAKADAAKAKADAEKAKADAAKAQADTTSPPASTSQYPLLTSADRHVVDRFSYGWSQDLARDVTAAGGGARWFEQQLSPQAISDPATTRMVSENWFPVLNKDYAGQWKDHVDEVRFTWEAGFDLSRLSLARKIASRRQVHEMMSEFWLNHLYIPAGEDRSSVHRSSYEDLVRSHALGSFRAMLKAAIQHPAMIGFLTNYANTGKALNENLGRELLELHTVGVGAGYGEDGVKTSARILTGFTLDTFKTWTPGYDTSRHWTGPVSVMGFSHANTAADGRPVLEAYLDHLARHDRTAERLARKLCVRFVRDDPSASIVAAVKKAYLDNDTAIAPMLRALVAHPDFANSRGIKLRTPVEDLVATARALGAVLSKPLAVKRGDNDPNFTTHLGWMSENLGYRPYSWPRPDGPPDQATEWDSASRMIRTWENRYSMAGGWWQSKAVTLADPSTYLPTTWPQRLDAVVNHIGVRLTGKTPTATELAAAISVLVDRKPDTPVLGYRDEWKYLSAWDFLRIRGTLLNSPDQILR